MSRKSQLWMALMILGCALPVAAQDSGQKQPDQPQAAMNATETQAKSATSDPNYVIGPDDRLSINVWKTPELTEDVQVRPDGKISMPLLNDVQAAGLTPTQLGHQITEQLQRYNKSDALVATVIVKEILSQRIYVLGQVMRAGAYPMLPGMTVLQALSTAGGFSQFANEKKVYILRTDKGSQHKFAFNYKDVVSGKQPGENIVLKAGDTIVVP